MSTHNPQNNHNLPPGVSIDDVDPPSLPELEQEYTDACNAADNERKYRLENPSCD